MGLEERPDTVGGKTERQIDSQESTIKRQRLSNWQTDRPFFVKLPYSATELIP